MICVKMEKTRKLRKIKSKRKSQMTIHRTGKTTQQKKKNWKPKRNISRVERDAFYKHQVTMCGKIHIFLKKKPKLKEYKIIFC